MQVQVQARSVVVLDLAHALHASKRGVSVARRLSLSNRLGWLCNVTFDKFIRIANWSRGRQHNV